MQQCLRHQDARLSHWLIPCCVLPDSRISRFNGQSVFRDCGQRRTPFGISEPSRDAFCHRGRNWHQCRRLRCRASNNGGGLQDRVSLVLLAGGSGKRMGAPIPKQYLELAGQPIAMYSLQVFANMPEVFEIIVVCNPEYRDIFEQSFALLQRKPHLRFAKPGIERQDSVYNGFKAIDREQAVVVAIHDSARPLVTAEDSRLCLEDAAQVGAAVLGVPVKPTIKEVSTGNKVVRTINRANLWEVQTPQAIKPELLQRGFELVKEKGLEVTDDVSIIEALGEPVLITKGSYTNIKVTTPDDLLVAEGFLRERQSAIDVAVTAK